MQTGGTSTEVWSRYIFYYSNRLRIIFRINIEIFLDLYIFWCSRLSICPFFIPCSLVFMLLFAFLEIVWWNSVHRCVLEVARAWSYLICIVVVHIKTLYENNYLFFHISKRKSLKVAFINYIKWLWYVCRYTVLKISIYIYTMQYNFCY